MVPSMVVCLSEWPRTSSGKIDRKLLPSPSRHDWVNSSAEQRAPSTATEMKIAQVWKDLLGVPEVYLHDNFFELGGNSLRVMQMLPRLHEALGDELTLGVADVFLSPTVAGLSALLDAGEGESSSSAQPPLVAYERDSGESSWMPASFAQEQMLVLHSLSPESSLYNVPWCVRLDGAVDVESLTR